MVVVFRKRHLIVSFCICFLIAWIYHVQHQEMSTTFALPTAYHVVVIDPGHGGIDPGKVGEQGWDEKDINLQIALILQQYLEQSGASVWMTRTEDRGLYKENDTNKKRADLKKRVQMINDLDADIAISIHQNSFSQKQYKGAQVFYYTSSEEGKYLAELIQQELISFVDPSNNRAIKANDSYYLLKQSLRPTVIVECGFLSNPEEERKLNDEKYQQKIAWGIYMGIMKYFYEWDHGTIPTKAMLSQ